MHYSKIDCRMVSCGSGRAKTQSDLIRNAVQKGEFSHLLALRVTTDLKIIGVFIPRGVFPQPGS